jgi:hypothetical protein
METSYERNRINPKDLAIKLWPKGDFSHVTYDPDMRMSDRDYFVARQCGHDGTMLFTYEMFQKALIDIANMTSYHASNPPKKGLTRIEYTVGPARHPIVFGMINLKCGRYPGQRERIRFPVKVKYIYGDSCV